MSLRSSPTVVDVGQHRSPSPKRPCLARSVSCSVLDGEENWSLATMPDINENPKVATLASLQAEIKLLKDENARYSSILESISKLAKQ